MVSKSDKTEVDQTVTEPTTVSVQTPFEQMLRAMSMDAVAEIEAGKFSGDDLNAILTAKSEAELWDADERGPLNFQHLADCEIGIMDVHVKYSRGTSSDIVTPFVVKDDKGNDRKMYLIVSAVRLSDAGEKSHLRLPSVGEVFEANTSARFVVAKIWAFYTRGYINPDTGKTLECVVKEIDLGGDQAVLKLRPMPRRVVRTETV
jgi:hypothetical protein